MALAEEILMCFIRGWSWAGLPKSRARARAWVQVVYLVGDARKQEAGLARGRQIKGQAEVSVIFKITVKDSGQ